VLLSIREQVDQYIKRSSATSASHPAPTTTELPDKKVLAISVQRAHSFQRLKEEAKHYCLMELAQIRALLLSIDARLRMKNSIFQLQIDELDLLRDISTLGKAQAIIRRRQGKAAEGSMNGKRVSGESSITGTARVVTSVDEIESFVDGEILVARMTDPTWYPLFSRADGIVTEVGGWLSHAAIVAREYDLPAIVGVNNVCNLIKSGDQITLNLDGTIDINGASAQEGSDAETSELPDKTNAADVTERIDRRSAKSELSDRRSEPRYHKDTGGILTDRRKENRLANVRSLRDGYIDKLKKAG